MNKALVTGANKGIGYGIAKELIKRGWHVLVGARNKERGEAAVNKLNAIGKGKAEYLKVDLSNYTVIASTCEEIKDKHSDLKLLINNAGIPGDMSVLSYETQLKDIIETTQVNFFGTFYLCQGLISILSKNNGKIINITVPTSTNPYWNPLAYKASKAAQNCMSEHFAFDFQKNNIPIEIYTVHPGPTTTDLNGNMSLPGFHKPDEVGKKIVDLLYDEQQHQGEFIEIYPIVAE
ncbi:SDR family NAD(P)-dependent oxidoreductase [Prevotella amnii]|jgi:hypothetical protein|uniref:Oxidoreductase, short chain dehydrogenase/reductase family protein n=2 Tax=Prevotella amnii TaxID=419005 RepID=A0A134BI06_9BACT|nr:SDR family NAD(P)-dependent oxidoreductase [Prevotella amnii]EFN90346.1 oxidoreductase, short chain dehydrogenase/reductase family protein [Prevotella amnii CRIS 21A-A]KXB79567.1 oxidoreductase, short chain dehydrogenase/reductase family protein [Prevotella amnii]